MATLNLSYTIDDADFPDIRDALCERWGYNAETDGTKAAFIKRNVGRWIKDEYRAHKSGNAAAAAADTAAAAANAVELT
jgi:hypothetical protein